MAVTLRRLGPDDWAGVLALDVAPDQQDLVASVDKSRRGPRLLGSNWVIGLPDGELGGGSAELQAELVEGEPGHAEQQACVGPAMDFTIASMPDTYGNTDESAMQYAVFAYGTDSLGYKVAVGHAIPKALSLLTAQGRELALVAARASAVVTCANMLAN